MSLRIERCLCYNVPFERLKAAADATGIDTVQSLQEHVRFGLKCRLCHPYVRRMLRTGETVFGEVVTAADEPAPCALVDRDAPSRP